MAHARSQTTLIVHVVWATKGRAPMLPCESDDWLDRTIRGHAQKVSSEITAVGSGADHVHVLVHLSPAMALARVVQQLKGATAHEWNARFLERIAWQDGYWAESCSPRDTTALGDYVRSQRAHHSTTAGVRGSEAWERAFAAG
jgi:putative transposase